MPFYSARNLCPNCAKPIHKDDAACADCGAALESSTAGKHQPLPDGVVRHRGNRISILTLVCGLSWCVGWPTLACSGYYWNGTIQSIVPLLGVGLPVVATGQLCGVAAVVFAYQDLLGMKTGRVDRAGRWPTMIGGASAVFFVLQHWLQIGLHLYHLL